jgi:hypothetical protein
VTSLQDNSIETDKRWLVEIHLKDWVPDLKSGGRTLTYVEVLASSNVTARFAGYDEFVKLTKYVPAFKKMLESNGLTLQEICAPDAVDL